MSGRSAVPTLVDADGYFFPSGEALYLDALSSPRFTKAVKAHDVRLLTYRQLIQMKA